MTNKNATSLFGTSNYSFLKFTSSYASLRLSCGDSKKVVSEDFVDFYQRGESDCNSDVSSADEYDFYCDEEAGLDSNQVCTIVLVGKSALWDCQNGL